MVAHIIYKKIDSSLACESKIMIQKIIRRKIRFKGLLISDDITMKAIKGSLRKKVKAILSAGCDIVLHCSGNIKEIKSIQNSIENKQPSNLEAEQAILGSVLEDNEIFDEVSDEITPDHFFDEINKKIYIVISNLITKGLLANPITLKNYFENEKDELDVPDYLIKITKFSTSSRQTIEYSKIIYDMFVRRELIKISEKNIHTIMPGFTHLKNAQPLSLGHYLLAYVEMFKRDKKKFKNNFKVGNFKILKFDF